MVEKSHTAGWLPNLYEPLSGLGSRIADWFAPASEASTTEADYQIDLELPGVDPDDIHVSVDGNSLVVKGEKRSSRTEEGRSYYFTERTYGSFQRTFRLPADADTDRVSADTNNGVLMIRVPKKKAEETSRRIKVGG